MRNWNVVDPSGKVHILRAWSARHARFIAEASSKPFTPTKITLIGRANPDNEDGWINPARPAQPILKAKAK